jgi:DNA-binding MarR family transcriptional regulator
MFSNETEVRLMVNEVENIFEQAERIFNKYQALRKKPITFDKDIVLYRSELHTIEVIGNTPNINVTNLAHQLGITKGAVSQCLDKLCKKQMVTRKPSPLTDNEVALTLTERGKDVYESHESFHKKMYSDFEEILKKYPAATRKAVSDLLSYFEHYLS